MTKTTDHSKFTTNDVNCSYYMIRLQHTINRNFHIKTIPTYSYRSGIYCGFCTNSVYSPFSLSLFSFLRVAVFVIIFIYSLCFFSVSSLICFFFSLSRGDTPLPYDWSIFCFCRLQLMTANSECVLINKTFPIIKLYERAMTINYGLPFCWRKRMRNNIFLCIFLGQKLCP